LAQSVAAGDLEASNYFIGRVQEYGAEKGLDPEDPEQLQVILSDKEFVNDALAKGATRGSVVASTEAVGNLIAPGVGRLTNRALRGTVRGVVSDKVLREAGSSLVEGVAGGTGEALGSVAIGEDIDWANVRDEALAEVLPGGVVRGINKSIDR